MPGRSITCVLLLALCCGCAVSTASVELHPDHENGTWGFRTEEGGWAIAPRYLQADPFEYGRAVVRTAEGFGLIDSNGTVAIAPKYDQINTAEGRWIVSWSGAGYALFNADGRNLTGWCQWIGYFTDDLAPVQRNGLWGLINRDGDEVISVQYHSITRSGALRYEVEVPEPDDPGSFRVEEIEVTKP
jgi:hypothetical protein